MQTFLPEPTYEGSVAVLDNKRLNKQLLEGYQILDAIAKTPLGGTQKVDGKSVFAANHPATNMWRGSEGALWSYLNDVAVALNDRGIRTLKNYENIMRVMGENPQWPDFEITPAWMRDEAAFNKVMFSHKANLYFKDQEHYAQYAGHAGRFTEALVFDPLSVVCCATRRQGRPCGYYWPTH